MPPSPYITVMPSKHGFAACHMEWNDREGTHDCVESFWYSTRELAQRAAEEMAQAYGYEIR